MTVKDLVENIKHNGLLVSASLLEKLYTIAIENEQKLVAVTEQRDALVVENVALKKVISDVQGVYYKSDGVAGYHLNGQIATWDEVMPDLWEIETPATDAAIAALREEATEAAFNSDKHAALCDSAYVSGMQAGWNFGADEDVTGFQQSLEAYRKPMREARCQLRESKGANHE